MDVNNYDYNEEKIEETIHDIYNAYEKGDLQLVQNMLKNNIGETKCIIFTVGIECAYTLFGYIVRDILLDNDIYGNTITNNPSVHTNEFANIITNVLIDNGVILNEQKDYPLFCRYIESATMLLRNGSHVFHQYFMFNKELLEKSKYAFDFISDENDISFFDLAFEHVDANDVIFNEIKEKSLFNIDNVGGDLIKILFNNRKKIYDWDTHNCGECRFLTEAIYVGNADIFKSLLNEKATINDDCFNKCDNYDVTLTYLTYALYRKEINGDIIKLLVDNGASLNNKKANTDFMIDLMEYFHKSSVEYINMFKIMIDCKIDIDFTNEYNETIINKLLYYCHNNYCEIIEYLLKNNANVNHMREMSFHKEYIYDINEDMRQFIEENEKSLIIPNTLTQSYMSMAIESSNIINLITMFEKYGANKNIQLSESMKEWLIYEIIFSELKYDNRMDYLLNIGIRVHLCNIIYLIKYLSHHKHFYTLSMEKIEYVLTHKKISIIINDSVINNMKCIREVINNGYCTTILKKCDHIYEIFNYYALKSNNKLKNKLNEIKQQMNSIEHDYDDQYEDIDGPEYDYYMDIRDDELCYENNHYEELNKLYSSLMQRMVCPIYENRYTNIKRIINNDPIINIMNKNICVFLFIMKHMSGQMKSIFKYKILPYYFTNN